MPEARRVQRALYLNAALNVLTHPAFFGARLILPLYALQLGAPAYAVGLLASLLWVFPLLLSWQTGRIADRRGPRRLLMYGFLSGRAGTLARIFHQ